MTEEKNTCCFCGCIIDGPGNNPEPVASEGVCCDACNWAIVIPARMELVNRDYLKIRSRSV